jgi:receptor expression-enhancing protein 1/2/3/4
MVSSLLARCLIVTIGTLYPAYRSYKSLINSDLREVVTWLRYWIVFAIFIACETVTDVVLSWFPFYYWIKIIIIFWIVSPTGSTLLYKRFIQPLLKEREPEIDKLIEDTRQRSYSALIDLTNKGLRYASNAFLNTAVLGQTFLGEHLKRSLSANDINTKSSKNSSNPPPATLYEENEEENDPEFTNRLNEDRKYLTRRKPLSNHQDKPRDPLDDYEMSKVLSRKPRNGNNENASKRKIRGTKSDEQERVSSNETDDEIENILRRT